MADWSVCSPEKLMSEAGKYRQMAYVPYSEFSVGAALLFSDGSVIGGCNVENASYGLSICAERAAMLNAVVTGRLRPIAAAVYAGDVPICSPCGACRQFLAEFNHDMEIVMMKSGELFIASLSELLPHKFSL
ncbi:cytidine deaminase [Synergistales bacterium]|nr:cytidine deaminase [Synergistales bacterium]GHV52145.1 cytidine deaminase [Synergistales bacterium]